MCQRGGGTIGSVDLIGRKWPIIYFDESQSFDFILLHVLEGEYHWIIQFVPLHAVELFIASFSTGKQCLTVVLYELQFLSTNAI